MLMKQFIKTSVLKFLYPHFISCTPYFANQEVQKNPVKTFSGNIKGKFIIKGKFMNFWLSLIC